MPLKSMISSSNFSFLPTLKKVRLLKGQALRRQPDAKELIKICPAIVSRQAQSIKKLPSPENVRIGLTPINLGLTKLYQSCENRLQNLAAASFFGLMASGGSICAFAAWPQAA
ncbi:hypothetical protein VB780_26800 [Leptolyngbya sp. CCNP1308]|uniref:hypothetical protein n=1 Tax=Leptolyngbya sp. CCNP1308 TaxID=3110255 RepID=UPI002B2091BB|nr:hypothetical protein [Leptolyngbya sp. CCNP1308]MEA5452212.1 hypothetical protein [Leptolyngbya sp. CCNP1308]